MTARNSIRSAGFAGLVALFITSLTTRICVAQDITVHKFVTETARFYDNELVTDGTHLFGVRFDGHIDGKGAIFRTGMNGEDFEVIYNFDDPANGYNPVGTLVLSGTTLYGMTIFGGDSDVGIIFKIETDGSGFQKLFDFDIANGALPFTSLTISGSVLYGTTQQGGSNAMGVAFSIGTDGSNYKKLFDFNGSNGHAPVGSLAISGDLLYGVTNRGGTSDGGVIYRIQTNGEGHQVIFNFNENTGYNPYSGLIISGTTLYGTTGQGGLSHAFGSVFKINSDGTGFEQYPGLTASNPNGRLTLINNTLYGMTAVGGYGSGIIYAIDIVDKTFTTLHEFNRIDGENPSGSLLFTNGKLYGVAPGGMHHYGVIFTLEPGGNTFTVLKEFETTNTGFDPRGGLVFTTGRAYGVTTHGGTHNGGVIYSIKHDGSDYRVVHNFEEAQGSQPEVSLLLSENVLYGVTLFGGNNRNGVLFRMDTTGGNYEVLHHFNTPEGSYPSGSLADSGEELLYGVASAGGAGNKGIVYQLNKETREFRTIFDFSYSDDALNPRGTLVLAADSILYGLALGGVGDGIVYSIKIDGSDFTKIVDKDPGIAGRYGNSLALKDSVLYVTMSQGGTTDYGVLFSVETDGSRFKKLFNFSLANGGIPEGAIVVTDTLIYGMTQLGGAYNAGVSYSIDLNGAGYKPLFSFNEPVSSSSGRLASSVNTFPALGSISVFGDVLYATVTSQMQQTTVGSIRRYNLKKQNGGNVVTGIGNDEVRLSIYPNPTSAFITVHGAAGKQIALMDSSGRHLSITSEGATSVDVTGLPPGVYFLLVGTKSFRFVKR